MWKKTRLYVVLLIVGAVILTGCGGGAGGEAKTEEPPEDLPVFTAEELASYDGQNGSEAYIAIDGLVYDVTEISSWAGGMHNGFNAGADQTEALDSKAPHGSNMLKSAPVVGRMEE
jgi:predicted heme/steroid binding protein